MAVAAPTPARWRIAAAIGADRCDIYTDVDGVYTTDPRIVPKASRLPKIAYEEMLEMASLGRQGAAGALGRDGHGPWRADLRPLELRRSGTCAAAGDGESAGTLICDEDEIVEKQVVTGIAYSKDEAQITLRRVAGQAGRCRSGVRPAGRGQYQCRHDRPERLRGRTADRSDLHRADRRLRPGAQGAGGGARTRSATRCSRARPTSPRFR